MGKWRIGSVAVLLVMLALGCAAHATRDYYVRQDVDLSYIKRVAVLPFENLSADKAAGERMREMMAAELLASGALDVASLGATTVAFDRLRLDSVAQLKPEDVKSICQATGAQAVIYGTLSRYEEVKAGSFSVPEVACTFYLTDDSGLTIWTDNVVMSGGSFWSNYLGGRGESVTEVSLRAIRGAIGTLHH